MDLKLTLIDEINLKVTIRYLYSIRFTSSVIFLKTFFENKQSINIYFYNQCTLYSICEQEIILQGLKDLHNKASAAQMVITLYKCEYFPAFLFHTNNNNNIIFFYLDL